MTEPYKAEDSETDNKIQRCDDPVYCYCHCEYRDVCPCMWIPQEGDWE